MMRKIILGLFLVCALSMLGARPRWESVEVSRNFIEQIDADGVDVTVSDGCVYVTTRKALTVKVFTILGQLITQDTLSAGTHRLKMPAKGIYILKLGSTTRRVTI